MHSSDHILQHERTLSIDGMQLCWTEYASTRRVRRNSVPLVLLHGLHDCHLTWKHVAPQLALGRRVLVPDLLGCGRSARPDASYALAWHAQTIARWLGVLQLRKVDMIGHSFGGGVAQMLLLEPGLRVRRLGLVASGGLGPRVSVWLRLAALPGVVERFGQPFMGAGTRLAMWRARAYVSGADTRRLSEMNSECGSARAFARTVADVINWRGQARCFLHRAHQIPRLPAMRLFWGEGDDITPLGDAERFARLLEGVELVRFAGAGHYVHHEHAEALTQALASFLDVPTLACARLRKPRSAKPQPAWAVRWAAVLDVLIPPCNVSVRA